MSAADVEWMVNGCHGNTPALATLHQPTFFNIFLITFGQTHVWTSYITTSRSDCGMLVPHVAVNVFKSSFSLGSHIISLNALRSGSDANKTTTGINSLHLFFIYLNNPEQTSTER